MQESDRVSLSITTEGGVTGTSRYKEMNFSENELHELTKRPGCILDWQRLRALHELSETESQADDLVHEINLKIGGKQHSFSIKESHMKVEELDFLDDLLSQ